MKTCLLVIFALISSLGFSQSAIWTKGNAVWHYKFTNVAETGYTKMWESGDTTLLGIQCTKIKGERHSFMMSGPNGPLFESVTSIGTGVVYVSNDTVYYWTQDHFTVLYDFSAQVNDQWILQTGYSDFGCNDTSVCIVQSVNAVSLNGYMSTQFTVTETPDSYSHLIGNVNSRFGATGCYLFPFPRVCDFPGALDIDQVSFVCFEDDSLYYNPSGGTCEYYLGLDESTKNSISVFPNPSKGKIELLSDIPLKNIQVMSITGSLLKEIRTDLTLKEIDLSELPQGTYYLNIENSNGEHVIKPIQLSGR